MTAKRESDKIPGFSMMSVMVNFRHFLMSSALAVPLKGVNRLFLSFFAYGITDESFAVNITRFRKGAWDKWRALTVHHTANITWILSTVFGGAAGRFIPAGALGIDYALPGMFIALLVSQLQGRAYIFTGALAAVTAVFWKLLFPGDSYIVSAAVIAATGGYFVRRYLRKGEEAVT
jgi:predicted branched-subunit amino acid permease